MLTDFGHESTTDWSCLASMWDPTETQRKPKTSHDQAMREGHVIKPCEMFWRLPDVKCEGQSTTVSHHVRFSLGIIQPTPETHLAQVFWQTLWILTYISQYRWHIYEIGIVNYLRYTRTQRSCCWTAGACCWLHVLISMTIQWKHCKLEIRTETSHLSVDSPLNIILWRRSLSFFESAGVSQAEIWEVSDCQARPGARVERTRNKDVK